MDPTNLFTYATSELSQDAVLAWLLAWAHPDYAGQPMHAVGAAFLGSLLAAVGEPMPEGELESVSVEKQVIVRPVGGSRRTRRIDVVADVRASDGRAVVLIEDKTGAPLGAGQLRDTLAGAREHPKWTRVRLVPVYLRTGNAPKDARTAVEGWSLYGRADLLATLSEAAGQARGNAILSDFRAHIERLDQKTVAFRDGIASPWMPAAWHGYFAALEQAAYGLAGHKAQGIGWGHIRGEHNQGLWWTGPRVYPQITETQNSATLAFRFQTDGQTGADRDERCDRLRAALHERGFPLVSPRSRARAGSRTLSLGHVAHDFRSEPLDIAADAERLVAAWRAARAASETT